MVMEMMAEFSAVGNVFIMRFFICSLIGVNNSICFSGATTSALFKAGKKEIANLTPSILTFQTSKSTHFEVIHK